MEMDKKSDPNKWILGVSYSDKGKTKAKSRRSSQSELENHTLSFFRFTYRRDFPSMAPYSITGDAGWGCMLRSAQMLMGYTLRQHYLSPDWRLPSGNKLKGLRNCDEYMKIVQWFLDYPGYPHVYSLHHLVQCGMKYDKLPGEWYGPSTAALVLRDLARLHRFGYDGEVEILVTQGDTIYISEAEKICSNIALNESSFASLRQTGLSLLDSAVFNSPKKVENIENNASEISIHDSSDNTVQDNLGSSERFHDPFFDPLLNPPPAQSAPWTHSLLVLLPLRLGIHSVNQEYIEEIKEVLRDPRCMGILGGRPNHALYFVGYQENNILGFDPHTVYPNPTKDTEDKNPSIPENPPDLNKTQTFGLNNDYISQVHVSYLEKLDFSYLDPSLTIGFYFKGREEFEVFCEETRKKTDLRLSQGLPSLFCVQASPPSYDFDTGARDDDDDLNPNDQNGLSKRAVSIDAFDIPESADDIEDDYVFI